MPIPHSIRQCFPRNVQSQTCISFGGLGFLNNAAAESIWFSRVPSRLYPSRFALSSLDPLFPSRFSTPLQRALQLQVTRWGGIVNFRWTGSSQASDIESTSVTAFSPLGGHIHFPSLSLSNVDEVAEKLKQHATEPPAVNASEELHIYVVRMVRGTVGAVTWGGKVFRALREDIDRRILADPTGPAKSVVLGEVGHVGGHAFAANMLVFPHGEWLGQLTPEVVPRVLDAILSRERRPFTALDPPTCPEFWRGRMGLPKDEQLALHAASQ